MIYVSKQRNTDMKSLHKSVNRPRIAFADLSDNGQLAALAIWEPSYFTGPNHPDYMHMSLAEWQSAVLAFWMAQPEPKFMDDNSGRM